MKPPFFQRRNDANGFEELRRVIRCLKACRSRTRCEVGAGVSMANEDFIRRFSGIETFRTTPVRAQEQYWSDLSNLELELRTQESDMAMGVGLYRIWLVGKLAGKYDVAELLGEELSELSRNHAVGT